eukprot:1515952-Rhodomonas_salina.2
MESSASDCFKCSARSDAPSAGSQRASAAQLHHMSSLPEFCVESLTWSNAGGGRIGVESARRGPQLCAIPERRVQDVRGHRGGCHTRGEPRAQEAADGQHGRHLLHFSDGDRPPPPPSSG